MPPPPPPVLNSFDLDGVARYIMEGKASNIIVMAGAGISVSAGAPSVTAACSCRVNPL